MQKSKCIFSEEDLLAHSVLTHSSNTERCACALYLETKPIQMFATSANLHPFMYIIFSHAQKVQQLSLSEENHMGHTYPLNQQETVLCRG